MDARGAIPRNRLTKGALAAMAALSIAVVGCQEQGVDELESLDTLPSKDMTLPSRSADDMTDETMDAAPSAEASPSESRPMRHSLAPSRSSGEGSFRGA